MDVISQWDGGVVAHEMEPTPFDLIIRNIGLLVTPPSSGPLKGQDMREVEKFRDYAIGIVGDRIDFVGEDSRIDRDRIGPETKILDARGKCVVPGFVDPHTHLIFSGIRDFELEMKLSGMSYLEILRKGGGILHSVKETRNAPKKQLFWEAIRRLDNMILHGTTTAEAKSGYGLDLETEIRMLETIKDLDMAHPIDLVPTFLGAHAVPPEFSSPEEYVDYMIAKVIPAIAEKDLAEFIDVFCEVGVFDAENSKRYLLRGKEFGMIPKIHADEIENIGATRVAVEVGAVSADHLVKTTDDDIEAMVKANVMGVLLPPTPFVLFSEEFPRARDMMDIGLAIALATDLNPNCYTENLQMAMALAAYRMKMHPDEILTAVTINAAAAIGRQDEIGSIHEGKKADILILEGKNHTSLVYHFGVNNVRSVIKAGELIVHDGRMV